MKCYTSAKAASLAIVCLFFAACGGGGGNDNGNSGSNPPPTTQAPVTETDRASSATVGSGGGIVSATGSNGVSYTLEVPEGALTEPVEIRMTPISSMGGAPLAAQVFGAVQFEPSGLAFVHPATLRIRALPTQAGGRTLIGFTTADDGGDFGFSLARVDGDDTIVLINHFSTGGATEATAAELAQEPELAELLNPVTQSITAEERIATLAAIMARDGGIVNIVEEFHEWYVELVRPALIRADSANDSALETAAIDAYNPWAKTMDFVADRETFRIALAADLNESGPIITRIYNAFIDRQLSLCATNASLDALAQASIKQQEAQRANLAVSGSALDRASFLLRANQCVRPVLDPITLPNPLRIGTDFSLDARAQVIFNGNPNPQGAPFAFHVIPAGATLPTQGGFSDDEGRFTTVFRPTDTSVRLLVSACVVFPNNVVSDICASQEATGVVVSGSAEITEKHVSFTALIDSEPQSITRDNSSNPDPDVPFIDSARLSAGDIAVTAASTSDSISAAGGNLGGGATCENGGRSFYEASVVFEVTSTTAVSYEASMAGSDTGAGRHGASVFLGSSATSLFDEELDSATPNVSRSIVLEPGSYRLVMAGGADCTFASSNLAGAAQTMTLNLLVRFQ